MIDSHLCSCNTFAIFFPRSLKKHVNKLLEINTLLLECAQMGSFPSFPPCWSSQKTRHGPSLTNSIPQINKAWHEARLTSPYKALSCVLLLLVLTTLVSLTVAFFIGSNSQQSCFLANFKKKLKNKTKLEQGWVSPPTHSTNYVITIQNSTQ